MDKQNNTTMSRQNTKNVLSINILSHGLVYTWFPKMLHRINVAKEFFFTFTFSSSRKKNGAKSFHSVIQLTIWHGLVQKSILGFICKCTFNVNYGKGVDFGSYEGIALPPTTTTSKLQEHAVLHQTLEHYCQIFNVFFLKIARYNGHTCIVPIERGILTR